VGDLVGCLCGYGAGVGGRPTEVDEVGGEENEEGEDDG